MHLYASHALPCRRLVSAALSASGAKRPSARCCGSVAQEPQLLATAGATRRSSKLITSGPLFSVSGTLYVYGKRTVQGSCGSRGVMQVVDTFRSRGRRVCSVSCGAEHTAAVLDSKELFTWGANTHGQLGRLGPEALPGGVPLPHRISYVVCGSRHTTAALDTGELYTWGDNAHGQLGLGDTGARDAPQLLGLFQGAGRQVVRIACGALHSVAVLDSRETFAWGYNSEGELGLGDTANRTTPESIPELNGKLVTDLCAGDYHNVALLVNGDVYVWGHNGNGKLGIGPGPNRLSPVANEDLRRVECAIVAVSCGKAHSAILTERGEMIVWGHNHCGQLGLGDAADRDRPQLVSFFRPPRRVALITCGGDSTGAMLATKEFYVWGGNSSGELGLGHTKHKALPQLLELPDAAPAPGAEGRNRVTGLCVGANYSVVGSSLR
eukprot:m51a1_g11492 hypothetical protein (438) ;mRNA; f:19346-21213